MTSPLGNLMALRGMYVGKADLTAGGRSPDVRTFLEPKRPFLGFFDGFLPPFDPALRLPEVSGASFIWQPSMLR